MTRDSLLGTFELMVLLGILRIGDEASAPAILDLLEAETERSVSRGSVYVTLDRLEKKGLLESTYDDPHPERGGRPRRYVEVTDEGLVAIREARASLTGLWEGLEGVLRE